MEEREKWVQGVVKGLWDEMASGKGQPVLEPPRVEQPCKVESPFGPSNGDWREEIAALHRTLDLVDERVRDIREKLSSLN